MRYLISALIASAISISPGPSERHVNTLSPKQVCEGWILLFDGRTEFGWRESGLTLMDGAFHLLRGGFITSTSQFDDVELQFQYGGEGEGDCVLTRGARKTRIALPNTAGTWSTVSVEVSRRQPLKVQGQSMPLFGRTTGPELAALGFECRNGALKLREIKVRPLKTAALFNGKDLTGWNTFPGKKSSFTVENGAIAITNGPGDLQTRGKYQDFILQLECKTNGKHLNSGVFFRCREGEYQNGYEAQIRNQFTAEPKQVYTLEEYDPKSHKLIAKKRVKYAAVDYGTGAIYRRQPSRRQVAKDGEWFTMTILAHGNHFATWVNGIQVTDWTDSRPPSDNARTGCRREAGHISLQGHDPTTNLSFRNIRIAELN